MPTTIFDQIRAACQTVTERAHHVHLQADQIPTYVARLPLDAMEAPQPDPRYHYFGPAEAAAGFVLVLDAINFGSAYFPHLKHPVYVTGHFDGYFAISGALKQRYEQHGPYTTTELQALSPQDCATLFGQVLDGGPAEELMCHFAAALNELGQFLASQFNGQVLELIRTANKSAEKLVRSLSRMPYFQDVARHGDLEVPIYKRAQITVADLHQTFAGEGPGAFDDLDQLTIFADNAVPHVLRCDGILSYSDHLAARIDAGELLPPGSPEEVEIRAGAIHAVELMVAALQQYQPGITPMQVDYLLWHTSHAPRYQTRPPHRTRTIFY